MKKLFALWAVALLPVTPILAHDHDHHAMHAMASDAAPLSEGTVKKLDKAKGRVTLAHGPLKNLDMPAMTMSFAVAAPALLDGVKEGSKVRFMPEDRKGDLVITRMKVVK